MNRNKLKYWGKRLRLFGDAVSGTIAALAVASTGLGAGDLVIESLPLAAAALLLALIVWLSTSFISSEMDGGVE